MLGLVLRSGYTLESAQGYMAVYYCAAVTVYYPIYPVEYPMKLLESPAPSYVGIYWNLLEFRPGNG